jgi:hypothetical protein
MNETETRRAQRLGVLLVVMVLHAGLLAWIVFAPRPTFAVSGAAVPLTLLLIPPEATPRIRIQRARPENLHAEQRAVRAPLPDASAALGTSAGSDRRESGVDWIAEARRAVRAFEIRRDEAPTKALSVTASGDEWPVRGHHADESRTASGDWIVWIDANCYKVASGLPRSAADTVAPDTKCREKNAPAPQD